MSDVVAPVTPNERDQKEGPVPGVGLAVSGGGYRAMLFHLGAFLRLHELAILPQMKRISSVSGGTITAAKIALEWEKIGSRDGFVEHVVGPIRALASVTIDAPSIFTGLLVTGSVADQISRAYREHLFGDATLQDLPDAPHFVFNATNVETTSLFRFAKRYMADWQLGIAYGPRVRIADAVAASSAFPPMLSPFVLQAAREDFQKVPAGRDDPRFFEEIMLSDGGVYDNLGLETVWKKYETVLASDACGQNRLDPAPPSDWLRHTKRVVDIIHGQVSSVRKRQLIASYNAAETDENRRDGAYWGIASNMAKYAPFGAFEVQHERSLELAEVPTRLKRLSSELQERLINWGYAICDAGIAKHWPHGNGAAPALPYPDSGI